MVCNVRQGYLDKYYTKTFTEYAATVTFVLAADRGANTRA